MTMMDHYQTLLLDRLSELEEPIVSGIDQYLVELESSKKNLKVSLQYYYNQTKDRQDIKEYYHSLSLHEGNQNLFHPFHQLLKKTHHPLPYFVSKDLYLYPWVDLQLDGSIKNIYSGIHQDPQKLIEKDFEIIQKKYHRFQNLLEFERHKKEWNVNHLTTIDRDFKFNTEHIVPQSWYGAKDPMKGDLHHLFACEPDCNIKRSNFAYEDFNFYEPESPKERIQNHCGVSMDGKFEPEYGKGIVARAMLYFFVRYPKKIRKPFIKQINLPPLINWHKQFGVTIYEKHRNQAIYQIQGNRNPFIDFPVLVDRMVIKLD
jgi:deoxyribonuclease I